MSATDRSPYRSWPGPARALAQAIDAAVTAAGAGDAADFDQATAELRRLDRGQLVVLLGAVTRELLERAHPDGLDSDDAEQALARCLAGAGWYRPLDRDLLIYALTGALGVSEPDESSAAPDPAAVLAHGLVLIADQLAVQRETLAPLLDAALRELMREQTVEMP